MTRAYVPKLCSHDTGTYGYSPDMGTYLVYSHDSGTYVIYIQDMGTYVIYV